jgi:hypothetical protein
MYATSGYLLAEQRIGLMDILRLGHLRSVRIGLVRPDNFLGFSYNTQFKRDAIMATPRPVDQ